MINHHNWDYIAGPTFPEAVGDRYYTQDLGRDYWASIDNAGRIGDGPYSAFPVLVKDSNVTKGTLYTDINIPAAKGIVEYEVDVPNSYASLPPTVTQEIILVRILTTAQTDFDISSTATLDGVSTNYVKVTYNETDGSSRNRAKKAGSYVYEKAVSFTITVDTVAPTNRDLVLATLVGDGAASLVISSYPRTRNFGAAYDYVVRTQDQFDIIIDRVSANRYKIKDGVRSIFFKFNTGGYQMTGATSPLQEGDTWGYIETNQCGKVAFEDGTFIDFHQSIGYIEVNTANCIMKNVDIRGDKGAAAAIQRSFLLNANYVYFNNCVSSSRLTNTTFSTFEGSGTAFHNDSSAYFNCKCFDIDQSGAAQISIFKDCKNIIRSFVSNVENTNNAGSVVLYDNCENISIILTRSIDSTGNSVLTMFKNCDGINNFKIFDIDFVTAGAGSIVLFDTCRNVSDGYIDDIDADDDTIVFSSCLNITNIIVSSVAGTNNVYCTSACNLITNIRVSTMSSGTGNLSVFYNSNSLSNCEALVIDLNAGANACNGFSGCNRLTDCTVQDLDQNGTGAAIGFSSCKRLKGCDAIDIDSAASTYNGFYLCTFCTACYAQDCENGFYDCDRLSVCESTTNHVDGFDTCYTILGCESTNNTTNGFDNCFHMEHNRATGNGTQYSATTWADWAGARAAAATDAGGENA